MSAPVTQQMVTEGRDRLAEMFGSRLGMLAWTLIQLSTTQQPTDI
jgi:hypothetical protein